MNSLNLRQRFAGLILVTSAILSGCIPVAPLISGPTNAAIASSSNSDAQAAPAEEFTTIAAPDDLGAYLVYMGEAIIDPAADSPIAGVPRIPIFPVDLEGRPYQEIVMGRSQEMINQREADAKAFFVERFGVDVDDPALAERIIFFDAVTSPELKYRVYGISGMSLPKSGLRMHDTVWLTMVIDPEGLTLGGEFAEHHVPQGAILVWGEYYIETADEPLVIQVQSVEPMIMDAQGNAALVCELIHPVWGHGLAQGLFNNGHALALLYPQRTTDRPNHRR